MKYLLGAAATASLVLSAAALAANNAEFSLLTVSYDDIDVDGYAIELKEDDGEYYVLASPGKNGTLDKFQWDGDKIVYSPKSGDSLTLGLTSFQDWEVLSFSTHSDDGWKFDANDHSLGQSNDPDEISEYYFWACPYKGDWYIAYEDYTVDDRDNTIFATCESLYVRDALYGGSGAWEDSSNSTSSSLPSDSLSPSGSTTWTSHTPLASKAVNLTTSGTTGADDSTSKATGSATTAPITSLITATSSHAASSGATTSGSASATSSGAAAATQIVGAGLVGGVAALFALL